MKYELKTFYCPQSLLPSTDAAQDAKKNRSATAFCCPECFTSLVIQRGTSTELVADDKTKAGGDSAGATDAMSAAGGGGGGVGMDCYFSCPYCRWTSLPDLHDVSPKMLVDLAFQREQSEVLDGKLRDAIDRTSEAHDEWARGAVSRAAANRLDSGAGRGSGTGKDARNILARIRSLRNVNVTPGCVSVLFDHLFLHFFRFSFSF